MTARTRRASPGVSCPHERDRRDCGTCVAAAHDRAVMTAEVRLHAAPPEAFDAADAAHTEALDAQRGHRILRESGIALAVKTPWPHLCPACSVRSANENGVVMRCRNLRCSGRRVRCELPEVRGR